MTMVLQFSTHFNIFSQCFTSHIISFIWHQIHLYCVTLSFSFLYSDLHIVLLLALLDLKHLSPFSIVLSQYTSITLPFPIVFNGGWSSMSQYIEKGLIY